MVRGDEFKTYPFKIYNIPMLYIHFDHVLYIGLSKKQMNRLFLYLIHATLM